MASLVYFLVLIALGHCHYEGESEYQKQYNTIQQLDDKIQMETYRKEFKTINYRLNKMSKVLEQVLDNVQGVQDVVGYPTTLNEALEVTNVETRDNENYRVVYNTDKVVKYVDEVEGEIPLPKGSSILTVKHEGTEKYWNLMKKSDVMIYHHHGSPVMVYTYNKQGEVKQTLLGNKFQHVEAQFSMVIPEETFFVVEVLDKEDESFSVLSYSFFPGFVQEFHLKYPVEEQEGTLYKPTYIVRKYFGLEDVEPVMVNDQEYFRTPRSFHHNKQDVLKTVLRQYFESEEIPSEYQRFVKYNPTEEYYLKKHYYGIEQFQKVEGLLRYLVKKNILPVEILRELPIESYHKVQGILRYLVKKNILPVQILGELQTESYEQESFEQDLTSDLPEEIKEYLHKKYDMTPQDLKKYYEDIPSYVRHYFVNIPNEVRQYFQTIKQSVPFYLENIPSHVRRYIENTPMDVQKFFENFDEVKNYYEVLPMYIRKYFQIMPRIVSRYFQNIPEEVKYQMTTSEDVKKYFEDIPSFIREYYEQTPEEVKTFFVNTPEDISFSGKLPLPVRRFFEQTPRDVRRFFDSIKDEKNFPEVLPKYIRNYFQTKYQKHQVPTQYNKYESQYDLPKYHKYQIPSQYHKYFKYNVPSQYNKYESQYNFPSKYNKYETKYQKYEVPSQYNKYESQYDFPKYHKYQVPSQYNQFMESVIASRYNKQNKYDVPSFFNKY